jgi:hypothetical protein
VQCQHRHAAGAARSRDKLGLRAAQYVRTKATILATTQLINLANKSYKFV